MRFEVGELAG